MSAPDRSYRIYCYDAANQVVTADFVKAPSDEAAIAKVQAMGFGTKCEIWDGDRLVAQLEAERKQA